MRKISKEELDTILENHRHWLNQDAEGWEGMRADLRNMDLRGVDLSEADLRRAELSDVDLFEACLRNVDFYGAKLSGAKLGFTDLCGTNLSYADLSGAELCSSNLHGANLYSADLSNADLYGANLRITDLCGASLCNTILIMANLRGANLREADLSGARLSRAYLCGADLNRARLYISRDNLIGADFRNADLSEAILSNQEFINSMLPICCPEEGSFIGWKKAFVTSVSEETSIRFITPLFKTPLCKTPVIVKLLILNTAKRSSGTTRKCRCSEAEVLDIQSVEFDGLSIAGTVQEAFSGHDPEFVYRIGETVRVEDFDDNRWNECSTGIHFFITRQEAVDYSI